ncbi:MAG: trypsin-like serine protease, partial [Bacteriovoracia bacterium]
GLGIHYSAGRGVARRFTGFVSFYAPVHNGNSGGPLLNPAGEVIGVVHAQSAYGINEDGYNLAVAIDFIERDLREKLGPEHPAAETFSSLVLAE